MRVCPKCDYIDDAYWKHVKYSYYIDSCSYDNFKIMFPDLAKNILRERLVDDEHYVYRITKTNDWIERKAKIDFVGKTWSDICEASKAPTSNKRLKMHGAKRKTHIHDLYDCWQRLNPNQTKLFEVTQ